MLEKQLKFKSSAELFDAGYALLTVPFNKNTTNWRFKEKSFTALIVLCVEYANVSGCILSVYPMNKLETQNVGKTN
jgi:hypothetical protein